MKMWGIILITCIWAGPGDSRVEVVLYFSKWGQYKAILLPSGFHSAFVVWTFPLGRLLFTTCYVREAQTTWRGLMSQIWLIVTLQLLRFLLLSLYSSYEYSVMRECVWAQHHLLPRRRLCNIIQTGKWGNALFMKWSQGYFFCQQWNHHYVNRGDSLLTPIIKMLEERINPQRMRSF